MVCKSLFALFYCRRFTAKKLCGHQTYCCSVPLHKKQGKLLVRSNVTVLCGRTMRAFFHWRWGGDNLRHGPEFVLACPPVRRTWGPHPMQRMTI